LVSTLPTCTCLLPVLLSYYLSFLCIFGGGSCGECCIIIFFSISFGPSLRYLNTISRHQTFRYVARPKPEVFNVTKYKIHNVLQGVAPEGIHLTDHDKELYEGWSADNARRYWIKGPFVKSNVIVIDDPQCKVSTSNVSYSQGL
jgi:hypothetical protein